LFPDGATKPFVRHLKALQENLGQHQDNEVHAAELRAMATEMSAAGASPHTLVAMGELAGAVDRRRADARAAFAEIFVEYQSKATRRLLRDLLSGLDG
jgi:CHAD domain-containing protein